VLRIPAVIQARLDMEDQARKSAVSTSISICLAHALYVERELTKNWVAGT
jgi:hypothetical protein